MKRLLNQIAIVTGAGGGIGQTTAGLFAKEGAKVVIAERDLESGRSTSGWIDANGGEVVFIQTDVASHKSVNELAKKTLGQFGQVDILVNSAGIAGRDGHFLNITNERWNQVLGVNLTGVFICSQVISQIMVEKGIKGRIVNIASINSLIAQKEAAAYVASKGGVLQLTKAMAVDLASYGIRVNCISPGSIRVARNKPYLNAEPMRSALLKGIPLGSSGIPEDVALAALFLSSEESAFITGANIVVDGGFSAYFRTD